MAFKGSGLSTFHFGIRTGRWRFSLGRLLRGSPLALFPVRAKWSILPFATNAAFREPIEAPEIATQFLMLSILLIVFKVPI